MLRKLILAPLLALPLAATAIDPGNWELTVVTTPAGQTQPFAATQTQCLTQADARDPSRVLGAAGGLCEFSNRSDSGGTFTFDVNCSGVLAMKGKGAVQYSAQTLEADLDLFAEQAGVGVRSSVKGRRLGPC